MVENSTKTLLAHFENLLRDWKDPDLSSKVNILDCFFAYRLLLGRNPNTDSEIPFFMSIGETTTLREFMREIKDSPEFKNQPGIMAPDHYLMAELSDFRFWFNTSDSEMGVRMGFGIYEPETVQYFRNTIKAGWCCWDVGAQTGFFTCLFSELAGSAGRVIAYEPLEKSFNLIKKNLQENGLEARVVAKNVACSDIGGNIPMSQISQMFVIDRMSPSARPVQCVRLDEEDNPLPNIIKIDVEGHEPAVIRGLAGVLGHCNPIIVVELNEYWLRRNSDTTPAEVIRSLNEIGYEVFPMESPENSIDWRVIKQSGMNNYNVTARRGRL